MKCFTLFQAHLVRARGLAQLAAALTAGVSPARMTPEDHDP